MAQPLSLLAATQAGVSPAEAGEALPPDLIALSLEQLMALRVDGRAPQDPDDALSDAALEGLAASAALAGVPNPTGTPGQGTNDPPSDLAALSLFQLMSLPVRGIVAEDLPEDLTILGLADLMTLRVGGGPVEEPDDEKDKESADEGQILVVAANEDQAVREDEDTAENESDPDQAATQSSGGEFTEFNVEPLTDEPLLGSASEDELAGGDGLEGDGLVADVAIAENFDSSEAGSDGNSGTTTVAVTPVNNAVGAVSDSNGAANSVSESAANDTAVGITALASDADDTDTVSYSLSDSAGGRFAIDAGSGVITVADTSLLDYETATSHSVTVLATSSDGSTSSQGYTVNLTDDTSEATVGAVSDVNGAANSVSENAANGTAVGITALASDADGSDTVSYSLSDSAGGRFAIDAGSGAITVADGSLLDYETQASHSVTVQATSSDSSTSSQAFTVNLTDDPSENLNVIDGTSGSDTLDGTAGDDLISGYAGSDTLYGDDGNDTLTGGAGSDVLYGGHDDDTLDGGAGNDDLYGEAGNDILVWDVANSNMDGGAGIDTLRVDSGDVDLTAYGGTIAGLEKVDMEADAGANSLTLTMQDVLDISDTDILTVDGDAGDSVQAGTGWTDGGIVGAYHVYTQGLATLNLDVDLSVNLDITS